MNLTVKEIIDNAIDEMSRAQETIKTLHKRLGEPIGSGTAITEDEMLIEDMNSSIEHLTMIKHTIPEANINCFCVENLPTEIRVTRDDIGVQSIWLDEIEMKWAISDYIDENYRVAYNELDYEIIGDEIHIWVDWVHEY